MQHLSFADGLILIMASNDVVIVAEFLVGVSNEVIEVQEVQELAADTVMVEERVKGFPQKEENLDQKTPSKLSRWKKH